MPLIEILENLTKRWKCNLTPPAGIPILSAGLVLPKDVEEFYCLSSGGQIGIGQDYELRIVPPDRFIRSNPVIARCQGEYDRSFNWFLLADYFGEYVTIDLNAETYGRCYDSFWDRHAVRGSCKIVARSFTEFLDRIAKSEYTEPTYFLKPGFQGDGDAYDRPDGSGQYDP